MMWSFYVLPFGKFQFLEESNAELRFKVGVSIDWISIVGFGSESSSRIQVTIQCYWFLFTA
ncbi:hypothetical protein JHK82_039661 [Glycine max]|uniref:Uncharacterized protein n=1 Tax=Glycine soja TaxID=3848 RepID=A0A0B2PP00_GLYSO|nr:hypothetical protein JHK87_039646 [Glycine soja]KAG5110438.1 hypothetical protein JHK82_039661 [Glycine max]KHN09373.1 hypothetical protein glysoja_045239 [Glycine soja]